MDDQFILPQILGIIAPRTNLQIQVRAHVLHGAAPGGLCHGRDGGHGEPGGRHPEGQREHRDQARRGYPGRARHAQEGAEVVAAEEAQVKPPVQAGRGGGETVLVVDDEESILVASHEALTGLGYQVVTANSGEKAMEVFGVDPMAIDLVVLDLGMPGMGGLDCLRLMRSLRPEVKVLVATGYADDADLERLRELGVREVSAKPYRFGELVDKIKALLAD